MTAERALGALPLAELTRLSGIEILRGMMDGTYPAPPFSKTTGIWLTSVEPGRVVFEGAPSLDFLNPLGVVHGGWTAAILDSAMGCCVHTVLEPGQGYTTVEFKVNLVRAVLPTSGVVRCEASVVHCGRRFATSEGRLVDGSGKLLAHGTETCAILAVAPGKAAG